MGMEISMEKLRGDSIGVPVLPAVRTRPGWRRERQAAMAAMEEPDAQLKSHVTEGDGE